MGYTNYWNQYKKISKHDWDMIREEVEYLAGDSDIEVLQNDKECIAFNGIGENAHEDFVLTRTPSRKKDKLTNEEEYLMDLIGGGWDKSFNFCKTNRKPYDLAVWHMLTYMSHLLGKDVIEISRDR